MENKGGAITMMHMVEDSEPNMLFDCIWLFRISNKNYKFQHLYMRIITLKHLGEYLYDFVHVNHQIIFMM